MWIDVRFEYWLLRFLVYVATDEQDQQKEILRDTRQDVKQWGKDLAIKRAVLTWGSSPPVSGRSWGQWLELGFQNHTDWWPKCFSAYYLTWIMSGMSQNLSDLALHLLGDTVSHTMQHVGTIKYNNINKMSSWFGYSVDVHSFFPFTGVWGCKS